MIKNYFKIALRNLFKNKGYSFINIFGLAIGMTCCFLILLFVRQEMSYDTLHKNSDKIYRVVFEETKPDERALYATTPFPVGPTLKNDFSQIENVSRVYFPGDALVKSGNNEFFEEWFVFADPDFFEMFDFELVKGNRDYLLTDPNSVVITESMAEKYFGEEEPVGKVIKFNNGHEFKVTGVVEDVPVNSHFKFDFVASGLAFTEDLVGFDVTSWTGFTSLYTYVMVSDNTFIDDFGGDSESFMLKHAGEKKGMTWSLALQPIEGIHLHSNIGEEIQKNSSMSNIVVISTIGLFILLIACINFMNLTTARSSQRLKEIGVRKVLGAYRSQLIKQFTGESILMALLSFLIALVMVELLLPYFSSLVGQEVSYYGGDKLWIFGLFTGIALLTGLLASIYPALFLSKFRPARVLSSLKGQGSKTSGVSYFRRVLVITQFSLSIILITGTLIIKDQLDYLRNADLGFESKYKLFIPFYGDSLDGRYETMKQEISSNPKVLNATASSMTPLSEFYYETNAYPDGRDGDIRIPIRLNFVDYDFIEQYGMEVASGRNFSKGFTMDEKESFIINESLLKKLGYNSPEEAIGEKLPIGVRKIDGTIIGVVKDFHNKSLHEEIESLVMMCMPNKFGGMTVSVLPGDMPGTLSFLEGTWRKFSPDYPFKYSFISEDMKSLYNSEEQTAKIVGTFSIVAIFVACLGLFGLAAFTADRRTKEIGIRKTLGASVSGIVLLVSKDFLKLVIIANLISIPVVYYFMNKWLEDFAYHTSIGVFTFVLAGILSIVIAVITIGYQSIKASLTNPVNSLKYE